MWVSNKKSKLPHGPVLTLITKRRNINLSLYNVEEQSVQGSYGNRLLYSMGFCLAGKTWTKDEEGDSDHEDVGSKKGKKNATSLKWKAVRKTASSLRKSSRLAKRKTVVNAIKKEDFISSQSLIRSTEVEDNLEISERNLQEQPLQRRRILLNIFWRCHHLFPLSI